jgi:hypothetical protein
MIKTARDECATWRQALDPPPGPGTPQRLEVQPNCCGIHTSLRDACVKALREEFDIHNPVLKIDPFVKGVTSVYNLWCIMICVFTDAQCFFVGFRSWF